MQSNKIATMWARIDTIPTLPTIVGRVTETIADPESSARNLMEIISPDQALTLKILKIANSAYYGRVRKTATLDQAVMILGFEEIRNLVISTAVFNNFRRLKATASFDVRKFWEHSFVCGLAARTIAKKMKIADGELFVAGLIHDIGKLAICMILPREFSRIIGQAGNDGFQSSPAEQQILGITHAEVGMQLVKRWMLPQNLVAAVGFHHRPAAAPDQTPYPIVIHLADMLAHIAASPDEPDDDQARQAWFSAEIVALAQSHGIAWHRDTLTEFMTELEVQRQAQAGILDIFLA